MHNDLLQEYQGSILTAAEEQVAWNQLIVD